MSGLTPAERVKNLHAKRGFAVWAERVGPTTVLVHITDADASRWLDLTIDEATTLLASLSQALS